MRASPRPGTSDRRVTVSLVPLFLVRHAHAGARSAWDGDDSSRPLSPKGYAQAIAIAALLADRSISYLGSSPAVRCVETLAPLVPQLEIDVHVLPELAEGSDVDTAVDLVVSLAKSRAALCAHGDLIPAIVDALIARGMSVPGTDARGHAVHPLLACQKGSVWEIAFDGKKPTKGIYHPPA